jgi:hypothetical protein
MGIYAEFEILHVSDVRLGVGVRLVPGVDDRPGPGGRRRYAVILAIA